MFTKEIIIPCFDIKVSNKTLIENSELKILPKQKYGLIGKNGCGKTTLLQYIKTTFNNSIDLFMVNQEFYFDNDKSIYDIVSDANFKMKRIKSKIIELEPYIENDYEAFDKYNKLIFKLNHFDVDKDEVKIRKILFGLGFDKESQNKSFGSFSGGWKMRIALARSLYMSPELLLLDEPTNHLDLNAVIWLETFLKNWKKSLILISHDIHFINSICNKIIYINNKLLNYYNGNYDMFILALEQQKIEKIKAWNNIQKKVREMRNKNIKKDIVNKYIKDNEQFEPSKTYIVTIKFNEPELIKSPYINLISVSYGYNNILFKNVNLSINQHDKLAIVGKNGVGKSTLLKLIADEIKINTGEIIKNKYTKIGYYHQHLTDILPLNVTPIQFLLQSNKNIDEFKSRKYLGSMGLDGKIHTQLLSTLSGGQKARVVLAQINSMNPHVLLLDEPTNHLDIESINGITSAINNFSGAVVMITHHLNIIEKTQCQLYELNNLTLNKINFDDYYDKVLNDKTF